MSLKQNLNLGNYLFKNYIFLNDKEKEISLKFRNKNRFWMLNTDKIDLKDHILWIESLKKRDDILYYLVYKDDIPFMSIDFHDIDLKNKSCYWGYFLGNENHKNEVLKVEKLIIDIAFNILKINNLYCINDINNHVIKIHKFFGFEEVEEITIKDRKFLKMLLKKEFV